MGKKKKSGGQTAKPLSPEAYIRNKARQLPVHKCYKSVNSFEDREMCIIVVRKHPQGTYTLGAYMIDKWCFGVKDSLWRFNIDEIEMNDFLSMFKERLDSLDEIDYVEAHNWVYGAVAFADEAGMKPCRDFTLTQYILAEDDENVELREYEFGRDGKYCLFTKNREEAARYIPILDRNLGKGNYSVETGLFGDDEIWDDDADDEDIGFPFKITPSMEYTYQGGDYPKEVELNFPELEERMRTDIYDFSDEDIDWVKSLPEDKLRADLQNLVLCELGRQWGKSAKELDEEAPGNWCILSNSLVFLANVANVNETLPIVLEVMRQSSEFREYNFGDASDLLLDPVLCVLVKDNPCLLKPFLLEKGPSPEFKASALELLEHIARNCPEVRQEIIDMTVELMNEYKADLPERTICDGTVTAFAIGILISVGAVEHLPLIEEIYATGLVDEACEGRIDEVRKSIRNPWPVYPLPTTNPRDIRDTLRHRFPRK